jgi:hypothetical protein
MARSALAGAKDRDDDFGTGAYGGPGAVRVNLEKRRAAMEALVGLRKNRSGFDDAEQYVRRLRRGSRFERVGEE